MYPTDPVAALRRAAAVVRPGGLICMHEADLVYQSADPVGPLWSQTHTYFVQALEKAGIACRMGPALHSTFRAAGLPGPTLLVEAFAAGGPHASARAPRYRPPCGRLKHDRRPDASTLVCRT